MSVKNILITGCSSGIGLCAALMLKERGYRVFAGARKREDVENLNKQGLEGIYLDLNDSVSLQRGLDTILMKTGGTLDALFNNAGFLQAGAIEDLSRDMIRAQFETNVFGPIELTKLVLPIMRKQGHGRIVQNSSILGVITLPFYGAYNASKFALEGFSRTLRQELSGTDIHVSIINPGPITSKLRQHALEKYQQSIAQQPVAYADVYKKMEKSYFNPSEKDRKVMQDPKVVVDKLIHALESKHPKTHYYIGITSHLIEFLQRIFPDRWIDKILIRARE